MWRAVHAIIVSLLFYEPKLLKFAIAGLGGGRQYGFSALLRAEIVEIVVDLCQASGESGFSALLRAEIVEICRAASPPPQPPRPCFSALLRAEIVEICRGRRRCCAARRVSVLFYEPKLLKCRDPRARPRRGGVSVLFYEPKLLKSTSDRRCGMCLSRFQCSSTSRNC